MQFSPTVSGAVAFAMVPRQHWSLRLVTFLQDAAYRPE